MRLSTAQLGMVIGIVSLTFFFVALMLAFGLRISAQPEVGGGSFTVPDVLWIGTATLVLSSAAAEAARYSVRRGYVASYRLRLIAAIGLAFLFLALQVASAVNLMSQGVAVAGNPRGSAFYIFMSIHGVRLLAGALWFVYLWNASRQLLHGTEQELRKHRRVLGAAVLFWHFMGVLWLAMFVVLRRWAAAGVA